MRDAVKHLELSKEEAIPAVLRLGLVNDAEVLPRIEYGLRLLAFEFERIHGRVEGTRGQHGCRSILATVLVGLILG